MTDTVANKQSILQIHSLYVMYRRCAENCYAGLLQNISENDHYKYCSFSCATQSWIDCSDKIYEVFEAVSLDQLLLQSRESERTVFAPYHETMSAVRARARVRASVDCISSVGARERCPRRLGRCSLRTCCLGDHRFDLFPGLFGLMGLSSGSHVRKLLNCFWVVDN